MELGKEEGRLAAALDYLRRGWGVLPLCWARHGEKEIPYHKCRPGGDGKTPLVSWKLFQNQRMTEDAAERYWRKWPLANVGVIMGRLSALVAWDIDDSQGADLLRDLNNGPPPPTVTALTGGGGVRLFYRWPDAIPMRAAHLKGDKKPLSFLGEGSYSVMPPSLHRLGGVYKWRAGGAPDQIELGTVTPAMVAALEAHKQGGQRTSCLTGGPAPRGEDYQRRLARGRRWARGFRPAVSGSGGRVVAFTLACSLIHGFGLSPPDALEIMMGQWNERCEPPWAEWELSQRVQSAAENGTFTPIPEKQREGATYAPRPAKPPPAPAPRPPAHELNGQAGDEDQRPRPKGAGRPGTALRQRALTWFLEPWILQGAFSLVVGDPTSGKSTFGAWLMARARRPVLLPGAEEDVEVMTLPRMEAHGVNLAELLVLDDADYTMPTRKNQLAELLARHRADLLWIDPIDSYVGDTEENNGMAVRATLEAFAWLARFTSCAVVATRHPGKAPGNVLPGSRQWRAVPRVVLELVVDPGPPQRRLIRPNRDSTGRDAPPTLYSLEGEKGRPRIWTWGEPIDATEVEVIRAVPDTVDRWKIDQACELLRALLAGGEMDSRAVYQRADQEKINDRMVRRAMQRLGVQVRRDDYGVNHRSYWCLPPS
jgi:hypothetical protein